MTRQHLILASLLWVILPAAFLSAAVQTDTALDDIVTEATVLYDAGLGTTPDEQGFDFLVVGVSASQQYANGLTVLDTTGDSGEQAGYFISEAQALDRVLGYKVHFTIQIDEEEHLSPHRAGFSVIVLSDDLLGLELAFWQDEIWVQEGGSGTDLFTHAEGVPFDTTAALITYELAVLNDTYILLAGDTTLLSGQLRDYTAFDGFPDVYETPGLLFLGDNTSRGAAKTAVSYVALETKSEAIPTPTATATSTPQPADKLYIWLPCLKGVDENVQE